jgi:two-component system nitrogen regulation sensor histidine kinase NtrY
LETQADQPQRDAPWAITVAGESGLSSKDRAFWVGLSVVVLSLISSLATYFILTGLTPIVPRNEVVRAVLSVNILLIIAMIGVIAWQVKGLWKSWKDKQAGARLHVRIVLLFSLIAALPGILLAIAATTTFARTFDSVSARTRGIVETSLDVVNAYLEEHGQVIRTDAVNMAKDLDEAAERVRDKPVELRALLIGQAGLRDLPAVYLIDRAGQPLVAGIEDQKLPYTPPAPGMLMAAEAGQVPLAMPGNEFRIAALTKLTKFPGAYLYVARGVSPKVVRQLQRTQEAVAEYFETRRRRGVFTFVHGVIYFMISLTSLLAAIWAGMWFAGRFVAPVRRLIGAAQEVSRGNLAVELPERRGEGDLRRLSATFNTMTRELKSQRDELVSANSELDDRRRFIEAMLSGVSAGVIGLDPQGRTRLVNEAGQKLLGMGQDALLGRKLAEAVPAFGELLGSDSQGKILDQGQVSVQVGEEERTFAVRITREEAETGEFGSVVTFDDITELVSAQRIAAWGEVARRLAHEIKNPLTPIMLSAERIRRKYGRVIVEDRETFDKLTATIERQAGDIKTMVDEFASFARIPKPVIESGDLREAVQEPMILFRESHPALDYKLVLPQNPVLASFDRRLLTQALTNLVKNATEAVESAAEASTKDDAAWKGLIEARLTAEGGRFVVEVIDNGIGLPKQNRARLLEPYVTTKGNKGTGLGLAIVQKIVEQHGGTLVLEDAPVSESRKRGALVRITLPAAAPKPATNEAQRTAEASASLAPASAR